MGPGALGRCPGKEVGAKIEWDVNGYLCGILIPKVNRETHTRINHARIKRVKPSGESFNPIPILCKSSAFSTVTEQVNI